MDEKTHRHDKSRFRIYAEYYPFLLLWKIIHLLPLKTGYAVSCRLFRLLLFVDRRHRRRTLEHLVHAGIAKTPAEARSFAGKVMDEFGKLLVEIIKMDQLYSPDKIFIEGPKETCDTVLARADGTPGDQIIIVTAHYGNWEIAGTAFSEIVHRPMSSFMRPFGNPLIGKLILSRRASAVHAMIDKRDGIRPILRAASQGRNVTMLIDQHASRGEGVECVFFGHPARVHKTPALLHLKTGLPIMPEVTVRLPGGNYHFALRLGNLIRYAPTGDRERDVYEITQLCISELERLIRIAPEQWLWAPRHWLDINRRDTDAYRNWRPPYPPPVPQALSLEPYDGRAEAESLPGESRRA